MQRSYPSSFKTLGPKDLLTKPSCQSLLFNLEIRNRGAACSEGRSWSCVVLSVQANTEGQGLGARACRRVVHKGGPVASVSLVLQWGLLPRPCGTVHSCRIARSSGCQRIAGRNPRPAVYLVHLTPRPGHRPLFEHSLLHRTNLFPV